MSSGRLALAVFLLCGAAARGQEGFRMDPQPPPAPVPSAPATWGTTVDSEYVVDSSELYPLDSANHYQVFNGTLRYSTVVPGLAFIAPLHLPSGAHIVSVRMDYYDASPTGSVQAQLVECDYRGQVCQGFPALPGCGNLTVCTSAANADGYGTVTGFPSGVPTVDNYTKRYFIAAGNDTLDGSTAISQFVVGYDLQVSPAPDMATFADVPTSHPFFQYIEALAASQVTGGCGGGNYCPDAALTRGQMAVFLAKALGLEFR